MAQDGQKAEPSAVDIAEMRVAQIRGEIKDLLDSMGTNNAEMTRLAAEIAGDVQNWRTECERLKAENAKMREAMQQASFLVGDTDIFGDDPRKNRICALLVPPPEYSEPAHDHYDGQDGEGV